MTSKENVWYKKYDIELKRRQFLESKVERIEDRYKILERETEKRSLRNNNTNEINMNLDITKSKFTLDSSLNVFGGPLKTESFDENEKSKNFSKDSKNFIEESKVINSCEVANESKECLLCGKNLHPVYESQYLIEEENASLK